MKLKSYINFWEYYYDVNRKLRLSSGYSYNAIEYFRNGNGKYLYSEGNGTKIDCYDFNLIFRL